VAGGRGDGLVEKDDELGCVGAEGMKAWSRQKTSYRRFRKYT
jgi:hypothetical protein